MFEIRQLGGSRRVVRLHRPSASPLAGAVWGVKQRGSIRWPHGSSRASALFAGPEQLPTTFEFRWLTRLLGDKSAELVGSGFISDADELVDLFRSIVSEKVPCFVRWRYREALAKLDEFTAEEGLLGEYEPVSLKVAWLEPHDLPVAEKPTAIKPVSEALRSVLSGYSEVLATARQPLTMALERRREFEAALVDVSTALNDTTRLVRSYAGRANDAESVGGSVAGLAEIAGRMQALSGSVELAAGDVAQVEGSRELAEASYFKAVVQRSALVAWRRSMVERLTLELLASGDILAIVMGVEGGDLRSVSLTYYGTPNDWQQIATFNGLPGSAMQAGVRVRVPRAGFAL